MAEGTYTLIDVISAAQNAGVNSSNMQTLRNFLILNEDYFDSDDYARFIGAVNQVRDLYITPIAARLNKNPCDLTEDERRAVYNALSREAKDAIRRDLINLAIDKQISLTWGADANGYPVVDGALREV